MRINAVTQPYSNELRKIESAKKAEKENKSSKVASADRSEFSSGAKRLSETKSQFETITASLSAQPDIRLERIAEVRRKIDNGYYNSDEFLDKLTNKMLNEFGITDK